VKDDLDLNSLVNLIHLLIKVEYTAVGEVYIWF